MATSAQSTTTWEEDMNRILAAEPQDRDRVMMSLSKNRRKKVQLELKKQLESSSKAPDDNEESEAEDWKGLFDSLGSGKGAKGGKKSEKGNEEDDDDGGAKTGPDPTVDDGEMDRMWAYIDGNDTSLANEESLGLFDYQGFDANIVIKTFIMRGKKAGLPTAKIQEDLNNLAGLAHKKGSVTAKNYAKMKKDGQKLYDTLAKRYDLKLGGLQGRPSTELSVSRIGPAVPGRIIRLLQAKKVAPKMFNGSLRSNTLHAIAQTQAFPAMIPKTLDNTAREYLVGLAIAYSTDQTLTISAEKKVEDIITKQTNFFHLTNGGVHPSEEMRKDMMKAVDWGAFYDKSITCASCYKKYVTDYVLVSRTDFLASVAKYV